jgi:hypothetical protein
LCACITRRISHYSWSWYTKVVSEPDLTPSLPSFTAIPDEMRGVREKTILALLRRSLSPQLNNNKLVFNSFLILSVYTLDKEVKENNERSYMMTIYRHPSNKQGSVKKYGYKSDYAVALVSFSGVLEATSICEMDYCSAPMCRSGNNHLYCWA